MAAVSIRQTARQIWAPPGRATAGMFAVLACMTAPGLVLRLWPAGKRHWEELAETTPLSLGVPLAAALLMLQLYDIVSLNVWWKHERRRRHGRCVPCGDDLTGNLSGVCPECGTAAATRR